MANASAGLKQGGLIHTAC